MTTGYYPAPVFLLAPAPEGGSSYDSIAQLYPAGRQSLSGARRRLDSGIDLLTPQDTTVSAGEVVLVNLQMRAINLHHPPRPEKGSEQAQSAEPHPWPYRLVPRSSISKTPLMLTNGEGIIDLGYRGPLRVAVRNLSDRPYTIQAGHALFQIVDPLLSPPEYEVLTEADPRVEKFFGDGATERGVGSFGSTGAAGSAGTVRACAGKTTSAN